jgi:hypothetical protein
MYEHGMATLALTEVLSLKIDPVREKELRQRGQSAVDLIVSAQNQTGGWRYQPTSESADLSVSIWQLMALRSAQEAKLRVPARTVEQAVQYVLTCYVPSLELNPIKRGHGRFGYVAGAGGGSYANQVSGLRALQVCGHYDWPAAIDITNTLIGTQPPTETYFLYATYYYSQAMQLQDAAAAQEAYLKVANLLLPRQRADGSWNGAGPGVGGGEAQLGTIYATSMALISLEVRHHRLPMFRF